MKRTAIIAALVVFCLAAEEDAVLSGPHAQFLDNHAVLRVAPPQGQAFAATLRSALAQAGAEENGVMCFDPGVGYRVWKGQSHTDICVCFYCEAVEIITKDARHKILHQSRTDMGHARAAFLALSRQAFPQDKALMALKTS